MGSFLCDPSVFKNKDLLCAAHGFQPMGDHDYGAFFGYFVQRLLHSRLVVRVKGCGRLVQKQDRDIFQKCSCQRNTLSLAPGQGCAAFAYHSIVALRQGGDEVVAACFSAGVEHLLFGDALIPEA